jgi:hypothetical protein
VTVLSVDLDVHGKEIVMREWQRLSHVKWYCRYHVVIVPKYRKKVIFGTRGRCGEGKVPETYSVRRGRCQRHILRGRCQRHIQSGARGKVPETYSEQLFLLIAETQVCHDRFASFPRMPS